MPRSEITAPSADDPVVYLATVPNETMARLWTEVLREDGITAIAKATGPGIGAWASAATFEHELYVLKSQRTRAEEIVRGLEAADAADIGDAWQETEREEPPRR